MSGFGGYSYGTANLSDHADTTKHLRWYNAHPYTYIPDGFTISKTGIAHMVDRDMNVESGTPVYKDSIIYGRGVWNTVTKDFDYTFKTLAFPCLEDASAADCKIAVSPDGNIVWVSVLTSLPNGTPLLDSTYYPVLRKSTDGGLTWSELIPVHLDGPHGISAVKNQYSDYFIENFFSPPLPTRDEIPYTTAFDHSLSVDKWGCPHIGVVIGYAPGSFSVSTGVDSVNNVYDIYSPDRGYTFEGIFLGSLKTFRGTWSTYTSDNRVYISRNNTGNKMFVTWNDTHLDGESNNQNPDVFARGIHLGWPNCTLTSDNGVDAPTNVTFLSDIAREAYWQCTSPTVFTDNNKYTIPICTQWFADASLDATFRYIPDFSFKDSDFTIPFQSILCYVGTNEKNEDPISLSVNPNPVEDIAKVSVNLRQNTSVFVEVKNLMGQPVLSLNKENLNAGLQHFSVDVRHLSAGVYFITVIVNGEKFTKKIIVE